MPGRIADEVIAHLAGLVDSTVKVTLDIEAETPIRRTGQCGTNSYRKQSHAEVH